MKIALLFLLTFTGLGCTAQTTNPLSSNKDDNTLLWEISGNGLTSPSYLFGTFHLMCKDDIRFSANLRQAIKDVQDVYFEMDLDDPANTFGALLYMNMKDGKTLKDLYNDSDYQKLNNYLRDSLQLPTAMLEKMKPGFLEAMFYPKMMPCKNIGSIEEALMKIAKAGKKEIRGFETIAEQAAVFDSIPYETQAKSLLQTIDSLDQYKKYFDTMTRVYLSQDIKAIEGLLSKSEFGMEENREALLDNRNRNWVNQLKKILSEKTIFMAVGAGHLLGENGLISLLRKQGYQLRPILNQ
ncbi:MAG: TraB/GumN family protein [Ferruginibacter sp.]|nr:TraB/GumN family protein [Ferruginibacter sp.]